MVDCTGLENRRTERYRGFESLSLRKRKKADRNSNLFEGLSAFSFCKDARGSARDGQSQSLSLRRKADFTSKSAFFVCNFPRAQIFENQLQNY